MKRLIYIFFLFVTANVFGQSEGNDTSKYVSYKYLYGNHSQRLWGERVLMGPVDTIFSKDGLATIGTSLYIGNGTKWTVVTGGSGGPGLSYPYTTNKYLNGYGAWVSFNTDSITEGSTNQWYSNTRTRAALDMTALGNNFATYNSSTGVFNVPKAWNLLGNSGTVDTNFIGTTDNKSLRFRTNNTVKLKLDSLGNLLLQGWNNTVPHTNLFRIASDDSTGIVFNVSSTSTVRSSMMLKPNSAGFTVDGSGSGFGPLKFVSAYSDSIYSMGAYMGALYLGSEGGIKVRIPSGSPTSLFSVEKGVTPSFMIKNGGEVQLGDTTNTTGLIFKATSTTKGVLFPRMNTTQMRNIVLPPAGTLVYNTDSAAYCMSVHTSPDTLWTKIAASTGGGGGGGGSGTVTDVATGYGLTGGPIVNTGTLSLDSAVAAAYFLRRKDSVKMDSGYATVYKNSLKVNISDTSSMLSKYLKKIDTASLSTRIDAKLNPSDTTSLSTRINLKVNISDTSSMLSKYLRKVDTSTLSTRIDLKLNKTDTASLSTRIDLKLNKTDTASLSSRINLKLNITDTANIKPRLTAGTNVTITGTYPSLIINAAGTGGGGSSIGVDSIHAISPLVIRAWNLGFPNNDITFVKDTLTLLGSVMGIGVDTINTLLADTAVQDFALDGTLRLLNHTSIFEKGLFTGTVSTSGNLSVPAGSSATTVTSAAAPSYVPANLSTGLLYRAGIGGTTTSTLPVGYSYTNLDVAKGAITLAASGKQQFLNQVLINDFGAISNSGTARVGSKVLLRLRPTAVSSFADTSVSFWNEGKSIFSDSTWIPTVSTSDSSNLAASTAWVLRQSFSGGSGGGISLNSVPTDTTASNINGATLSGGVLRLQPFTKQYGGVVMAADQTFPNYAYTFPFSPIFSGGLKTNNSSSLGNFYVSSGASANSQTAASLIFGRALAVFGRTWINGGTSTMLTAKSSYTALGIGSTPITSFTSDSNYLINQFTIKAPVITSSGAVIPETNLIYLDSVPTTGINNYAIHSRSGMAWFEGGYKTPNFIYGSDATGDITYRTSGGIYARLPIGTTGKKLTVVGGIPAWVDSTKQLWVTNDASGAAAALRTSASGITVQSGIYSDGLTTASGTQTAFAILPVISQSSTANYRALWVSANESTTGSGSKMLIDAGTSSASNGTGTYTSRFSVDNLGSTIIAGSLTLAFKNVSATYSAAVNDYTINCTSGTFTVTLPSSVGLTGKVYVVRNAGSGTTITIATTSSELIDGTTTKTLSTQYSKYQLQSTGAGWAILN